MAGGTFESDTDGTFQTAVDGTFVSATGGTFETAIGGTFESDTGGTFAPLLSAPGSHNNYVMRVGYMMNRLGIDQTIAVEWGCTHFAKEFPECEQTIRGCYSAAPGEFGLERQKVENLYGKRPKSFSLRMAKIEDIEDFLNDCIVTRKNVVKGRVEYKMKDAADDKFINIDDGIIYSIWRQMARTYKVSERYLRQIVESDFSVPYNPITDYLEGLPEWDESKPDYIAELARTVKVEGDEEEQALFAKHLRKWFVAMVASWIDPRIVNHTVLVLLGRQGVYKSTWFAYLLPPELRSYYNVKANSTYLDKDDLLALSQFLLICYDEIDTMDSQNANFLKAAVTTTTTNIRAAYAHYNEERFHLASLCGTGNKRHFLNDSSGSRRWLVYWVDSIVSPYTLKLDYQGIYSQAYSLLKSGFRYWFDTDETAEQESHNSRFYLSYARRL
jgi:predicted P-loop ATPase